jgi:DNA-binding beta-propeller fold protein YncE
MNRKCLYRLSFTACGLAAAVAVGVAALQQPAHAQGRGAAAAPRYQVEPLWPQPLQNHWVLGSVTGVAVDAQDHVWVTHRGADSLEAAEKGMITNPPTSSVCCTPAPFVLEFDTAGKLLSSFGGPGQGYQWPQSPGALTVDAKGNVWIPAAGLEPAPPAAGRGRGGAAAPAGPPATPPPGDAHVLKFSRDGKFLLQIGQPGKMEGPESQTSLNRPSAVAVDAAANEVYVADLGNRRIVVFNSETGAYKRHWGAYGEKPGPDPGAYDPNAAPARQFRDVTCIDIGKDNMVYVCDRSSNRIQVFQKDGKFVKEGIVSKNTLGAVVTGQFGVVSSQGSAWDIAFSNDAQQRYLFVADGHDKKVVVMQKDTLAPVGSIGSGGRYPGQFLAVGSVAVDSRGNLYTGEQHHGKRVQKFVPAR